MSPLLYLVIGLVGGSVILAVIVLLARMPSDTPSIAADRTMQ